jgi:hypothetical protein
MEALQGLLGGQSPVATFPPVAAAPTKKRKKDKRRKSKKRRSSSTSSSSSASLSAAAAPTTAATPERKALFFKRVSLPQGCCTYRMLPLAVIKEILHVIDPETCTGDDNTPIERPSINRDLEGEGGRQKDAETLVIVVPRHDAADFCR